MNAVPHFSRSYAEARERFLAAAAARGLAVESHVLPGHVGVAGETLAMDVAVAGNPFAPGLLILWSATHGIEGYCGSGCETAYLHDDAFMRKIDETGTAVLFVHALNPHGFSHGRRVNEDNADLNRNFRDFAAPPPVNTAYAEIHALLLPSEWPPSAENGRGLGAWVAAHGERAYQAAVSGGQYAFADGLFYGGAHPSWSNRTLRSVLRKHATSRRGLGILDFHTGLGPSGHAEKIYNGRSVAADIERTRDWWGAEVTSFLDGSSSSAPLVGINGNAVYDECPGIACAAIALEYGTIPLLETLDALRAEQWLHNHPTAPADVAAAIRKQFRAAFYIETDDWKAKVYDQARDAALAALSRLASLP